MLHPIIQGNFYEQNSNNIKLEKYKEIQNQEINLLYGEISFFIKIKKDYKKNVNITYSLPPNYKNQAPIYFEIKNDTTADIISYKIIHETDLPNIKIKFCIQPKKYTDTPFIHFDFWILTKNNEFKDLPKNVEIPDKKDLPEYTHRWLNSTEAVQSDSLLLKLKAKNLKNNCENLSSLTEKIVKYTSEKQFRKFLLGLLTILTSDTSSNWAKFLDAKSSLFLGGSCTGKANLGTALHRANKIPSRVVHVLLTWPHIDWDKNNYWMDMHYITEYYHLNYDWILSETTLGITPLEPKNVVILRINDIEDENQAGNQGDYFGGCEQWFWIEHKEEITIFWERGKSGAKGAYYNKIITDENTADVLLNTTKIVYDMFTNNFDDDLNDSEQQLFNNAFTAQKEAVECFKQKNITGYKNNILLAYNQLKKIVNKK